MRSSQRARRSTPGTASRRPSVRACCRSGTRRWWPRRPCARCARAWHDLLQKLSAYEDGHAARAGDTVERLGLARVRELLAGGAREAVTALIAEDQALESEVAAIASVEKLLRYKRDLHRLATNFA